MKIRELRDYLNTLPEENLDTDVYACGERELLQVYACEVAKEDWYLSEDEDYLMPLDEFILTYEEDPYDWSLGVPEGCLLLRS